MLGPLWSMRARAASPLMQQQFLMVCTKHPAPLAQHSRLMKLKRQRQRTSQRASRCTSLVKGKSFSSRARLAGAQQQLSRGAVHIYTLSLPAAVLSLCNTCALPYRWWAQWCAYTRYKQAAAEHAEAAAAEGSSEAASGLASGSATVTGPEVPERIDNSDICEGSSTLRANLEEGRDFVIVSATPRQQLQARPQRSDDKDQPAVQHWGPLLTWMGSFGRLLVPAAWWYHVCQHHKQSSCSSALIVGVLTAACMLCAVCFLQVTSDSWSLLHRWYGGGPPITRTAVMEGLAPNSKRPRVMLYPLRLEVCWGGKPNEVKTIEAEKHVSDTDEAASE